MNKENINRELDWDIATKVLSGEANSNEEKSIQQWINLSTSNKTEWEHLSKGFIEADKALIANQINLDDAYSKVRSQINIKKNKYKIRFAYASAAAVIILLIGIFSLYDNGSIEQKEIATQNSIFENYTLPDGSVININKNSKVNIPDNFNASTRSISLKGEAFFEVHRNTESPFIVEVGDIRVKVLGTSFNIKEINNTTEIIVASGKVLVYKNNEENDYVELTKGDKINYNRNTKQLSKHINADVNFLAWKTKELSFKKEPLNNAIKLIEEIYNVKITFPDDFNIDTARLSATFNRNNIDFITNVLSKTYNVNIEYTDI